MNWVCFGLFQDSTVQVYYSNIFWNEGIVISNSNELIIRINLLATENWKPPLHIGIKTPFGEKKVHPLHTQPLTTIPLTLFFDAGVSTFLVRSEFVWRGEKALRTHEVEARVKLLPFALLFQKLLKTISLTAPFVCLNLGTLRLKGSRISSPVFDLQQKKGRVG